MRALSQTEDDGHHGHGPGAVTRPCAAVFQTTSEVSHSVMYISLRPHGLQHTRLPCPSLSQSLLKFTSIELVMPSNHLVPCLLLLLLPSVFPSVRVFFNASQEPKRIRASWAQSVETRTLGQNPAGQCPSLGIGVGERAPQTAGRPVPKTPSLSGCGASST